MATGTTLLTAEEYATLPESFDGPTELVRGILITMPPTRPRHGEICARVSYLLQCYLEDRDIGRVVTNDAGIITERNPDSVRGADIAYYSYGRVHKGPLPDGLLEVTPEIVFEVLSPTDRWSDVQVKVAEYLNAGVQSVCVVDDDTRSVHVFHVDQPMRVYKTAEEFSLPDILEGFAIKVTRFFE
jgi:Uma2 family endonuclease